MTPALLAPPCACACAAVGAALSPAVSTTSSITALTQRDLGLTSTPSTPTTVPTEAGAAGSTVGPGAKAAASGGDAVPAVGVPSDDDDLCRAHSPMSPLGPPPFRPPSFILREFVSEPLAEYSPSGRIVDTDGDELVGAGSPDVVKDAFHWSMMGALCCMGCAPSVLRALSSSLLSLYGVRVVVAGSVAAVVWVVVR